MMYLVTILTYILIKFITKRNVIRIIFVSSIPLFFIATFNIYIKIVLNETLLSYMTVKA
jgi:hypothetical protein